MSIRFEVTGVQGLSKELQFVLALFMSLPSSGWVEP